MAAEAQALRAQLERLRDQGQATADGWRLDLAQALLARLEAHAGLSRQLLLARIDGLLATAATPPAGGGCVNARPQAAARPAAALAALTASLRALQQQRATAIGPGGQAGAGVRPSARLGSLAPDLGAAAHRQPAAAVAGRGG